MWGADHAKDESKIIKIIIVDTRANVSSFLQLRDKEISYYIYIIGSLLVRVLFIDLIYNLDKLYE
jgi:hypothetical protein